MDENKIDEEERNKLDTSFFFPQRQQNERFITGIKYWNI